MSRKLLVDILEETIEDLKDEIKAEIKDDVKEIVKTKIIEIASEDLEKKRETKVVETNAEKVDVKEKGKLDVIGFIYHNVCPVIFALGIYVLIAYVYFFLTKNFFYFVANNLDISIDSKAYLYITFWLVVSILNVIVAFGFYRLKQNKNTIFLYGIFEVGFGFVTVAMAGLTFIKSPMEFWGTDIKSYFAFYASIYVIVRGFETTKKHFDGLHKTPKVLGIDLSKERMIERFFTRFLKFK
ncbi:MATE family efflux transporter [Bacillus cereus]|uniref:hypothetical protein n=1 Tax=Bacillus cereus TaxID=1396 RepID=UPI00374868EA